MDSGILVNCCLWSSSHQDSLLPNVEMNTCVRCYRDKRSHTCDTPLTFHRDSSLQERGCLVQPSSKRNDKLKTKLPDFESLVRNQRLVTLHWRTRLYVLLAFANRTFVHVYVNSETGDVEIIFIDTTLTSKYFLDDLISDAVLSDQYYACTLQNNNKLSIISFGKPLPVYFAGSKVIKLSHYDPQVNFYDLPSVDIRQLRWRIATNADKNQIVVYARKNPVRVNSTQYMDHSRHMQLDPVNALNNLVVFTVSNKGIAVDIGSYFLENEIYHIDFTPNGFQLAEKVSYPSSTCILSSFVVFAEDLQRTENLTISMKGEIHCCKWSPNGRYCAVSSSNKELEIVDICAHNRMISSSKFSVDFICWHFSSLVLFLFSNKGEVQVLDIGGNTIDVALCKESVVSHDSNFNLNQIMRQQSLEITNVEVCHKVELSLVEVANSSVRPHTKILLLVSKGPFIMLDFITQKYNLQKLLTSKMRSLKSHENCIRLMKMLNWNEHNELLFHSISKILDIRLCRPIDFESEEVIEKLLDLYHGPVSLGLVASAVIEIFEPRMFNYTLRFIQMLLRSGKLEKALEKSLFISSPDSCMDVCHMALDLREFELANVARMYAENMLKEQNYPDSASVLFPKIPGPNENERSHQVAVAVNLPIPNLEELQRGDTVPIPAVEKAFQNMYLINEPLESDDSDEGSTDANEQRFTNTAKPKVAPNELFQFGIL